MYSFARITTLALSPLLGAWAVGPDYEEPSTESMTEAPLEVDGALEPEANEPAHSWWLVFDDEILNGLVATALIENRDLRVAAANVDAAQALLRLERTNRRPQGQIGAQFQRRRLSGAAFGQETDFPDTEFYSTNTTAAWEIDFFGRVQRGVEAISAEAGALEALRRDAQVLLVAETVGAYVDYRGAELQLAVAARNLWVQRDTLRITETRLAEGLGTRLDVVRARAQLRATEALIPPIQAVMRAAINRLATLTGATADLTEHVLVFNAMDLPEAPRRLAVGDASSLIARRADVRAAERGLAAATARIGLAKAEYFPRISLVGTIGLSAERAGGLGGAGSLGYSAGPQLSWSGFDVPRVKAQIAAAGARAESAYASFEQTVLVALEETQTALARFGREAVRLESLREAVASAGESAELARDRYAEGADDFIAVLDAEARLLEAEAALAASQVRATQSYVEVYRALGAGWDLESTVLAAR
ncbi:MAG: efflux transporter outer membrane subunit [Myxococcota bacterium]